MQILGLKKNLTRTEMEDPSINKKNLHILKEKGYQVIIKNKKFSLMENL